MRRTTTATLLNEDHDWRVNANMVRGAKATKLQLFKRLQIQKWKPAIITTQPTQCHTLSVSVSRVFVLARQRYDEDILERSALKGRHVSYL